LQPLPATCPRRARSHADRFRNPRRLRVLPDRLDRRLDVSDQLRDERDVDLFDSAALLVSVTA